MPKSQRTPRPKKKETAAKKAVRKAVKPATKPAARPAKRAPAGSKSPAVTAAKASAAPSASGDGRATVLAYNAGVSAAHRPLCRFLMQRIDAAMPAATAKVWHGAPVWFIGENPVVGYTAAKSSVNLLFWNGQAIDAERLTKVGKYGAAQAIFTDLAAIDAAILDAWLARAAVDVFDSVGFFKRLRAARG